MDSLFRSIWDTRREEEGLDRVYALLREKWEEYKMERITLLCFSAYVSEDEAVKASMMEEIEERGLLERYQAFVEMWEHGEVFELP